MNQLDSLDDLSQMAQTSSIFLICLDHLVGLLLLLFSHDCYEQGDQLFQNEVNMKSHLLYYLRKKYVRESPHTVKNKIILYSLI